MDFHDPLVPFWREMGREILQEIPSPHDYDAVIFTVPHREYGMLNMKKWLDGTKVLIFDSNKVLSDEQIRQIKESDCDFYSIGRG